jgi:AsmA-like C-terminal region/AsmA family
VASTLSHPDVHTQTISQARPRPRGWTSWPKWILLLLVLVWLASAGISLLIRHTPLQKKITARLAAAFGRPVEVGSYNFTLLEGPTLRAQSVTFGEDPRFGHEYFLRAESVNVRLRWQGLLLGHLQLGTVSLDHPSLNLVRNSDGDWNLAEWLPKPPPAGSSGVVSGSSAPGAPAVRFRRIEIDSGRINFKRGEEKLPFALVDVTGYVEAAGPGRWTMDLEAIPTRAAVIVQQAGVLHVSGQMGGTSSRLRPAELNASWSDASVSDVLRLARSSDYGVRGFLILIMNARTQDRVDGGWTIQSRAEFRQLHRWDLPLHPDDPAVNVISQIHWNPMDSAIEVSDASIEAPHSHARVTGRVGWDVPTAASSSESSPVSIKVASSTIDLNDLLAWGRAFHSDVAPNISFRGFASVQGEISGWPPQMNRVALTIDGGELSGPALRVAVHLGTVDFRYDRGVAALSPVALTFGAAGGSLRMETSAKRGPEMPVFHLTGNLTQARDLVAIASAFGWNISRGWDLSGPLRCDLRWQDVAYPWRTQPTGTVDFGGEQTGMSLRTPFLNLPIEDIKAHADWKPDSRHIAVSSADAFGADWSGSFDRRDTGGWLFTLSADHLAAADVDRWLNPRWRESFLDRMLPFLNPRSPTNAVTDTLQASGRIALDEFTLAPVTVRRLQGDMKVSGHHIGLTNARGQFYGGNIAASFEADFAAIPSYRVNLDFSRVDLLALSADSPNLAKMFSGAASGELLLNARGANKSDMLASLTCKGKARVSDVELRSLNLTESLRENTARPGISSFPQASSAFTCADREIKFQGLLLQSPSSEIEGFGSLDFSRNIDLRLRLLPSEAVEPSASTSDYRLTGPLSSPQLSRIPMPSSRP